MDNKEFIDKKPFRAGYKIAVSQSRLGVMFVVIILLVALFPEEKQD